MINISSFADLPGSLVVFGSKKSSSMTSNGTHHGTQSLKFRYISFSAKETSQVETCFQISNRLSVKTAGQ